MKAVHLTRVFEVSDGDDLDSHVDQVMHELLALESPTIRDADVAGSIADQRIEISVYATGDTFEDATEAADSAIRAAIHAAGGHTPDWVSVAMTSNAAELVSA